MASRIYSLAIPRSAKKAQEINHRDLCCIPQLIVRNLAVALVHMINLFRQPSDATRP